MFSRHRGSCQVLHIWSSSKQSRGSGRTSGQQPGAAGTSSLAGASGGKGWKKQNCHVDLGCPRLKHTYLPSSPPDSLLIRWGILCARGAEAGTWHRHMLLQFLEPLFTKLPVRNPRAWAAIPTWNSHPRCFMASTEPVVQSLQALLKSDMT